MGEDDEAAHAGREAADAGREAARAGREAAAGGGERGVGSKEGGIRGGLGSKGEAQVRNGEGEVGVGEGQVRKIVRDVAVDLRGLMKGEWSRELRGSRGVELACGGRGRRSRDDQARRSIEERGSRAERRVGQVGVGDIRAAKGEGHLRGEVRDLAKDIAEMSVEVRGPWSCVGEMRSGDPEAGTREGHLRSDEGHLRSNEGHLRSEEGPLRSINPHLRIVVPADGNR